MTSFLNHCLQVVPLCSSWFSILHSLGFDFRHIAVLGWVPLCARGAGPVGMLAAGGILLPAVAEGTPVGTCMPVAAAGVTLGTPRRCCHL